MTQQLNRDRLERSENDSPLDKRKIGPARLPSGYHHISNKSDIIIMTEPLFFTEQGLLHDGPVGIETDGA